MRRIGQLAGVVFVVLGLFWAGRESSHGVTAYWDHWWCPVPLALIALGTAAVVIARRSAPDA
jgi:hypothetical protein